MHYKTHLKYMMKRKCCVALIYHCQVDVWCFFSDLMSFLKQIRNETASTASCNNNIERDSSSELHKESIRVSDDTIMNGV